MSGGDGGAIYIQTRQLCPGWAKIPQAQRSMAKINEHRAECSLGCGYSSADQNQYVYKFIELDELRELLALAPVEAAAEETPLAPEPVKRTRGKAKAAAAAVEVPLELKHAVHVEDLLSVDDDLEDLLS